MHNSKEYIIINKDNIKNFGHSGVWDLFGKKTNDPDKWYCLQVGKTQNIKAEVGIDMERILSGILRSDKKEYINQFGKVIFEYYSTPTIQDWIYHEISLNYVDLHFVCIYNGTEDGNMDLGAIEKEFAHMTKSIYWRNGKPYKTGDNIDYKDYENIDIELLFDEKQQFVDIKINNKNIQI